MKHHHDWRDTATVRSLVRDLVAHDRIFESVNRISWLEVRDRRTDKVQFRTPVPALTRILILDSEQFIVGLSEIKLFNPYQIVVFSTSGELLYRRHLAAREAIFSPTELADFWRRHPKARELLSNRVSTFDERTVYVDFRSTGMPGVIGALAWGELQRRAVPSAVTNVRGESVSNYIDWYDPDRTDAFVERKPNGRAKLYVPVKHGKVATFEFSTLDHR